MMFKYHLFPPHPQILVECHWANQLSDSEDYGFDTNIGRFQLFLHDTPSHPQPLWLQVCFTPTLFQIVRHMYTKYYLWFWIICTCHLL